MQKKETSVREARDDGNATKAALIEVAARLIAKQGYEKTTSKEICELAKTNLAAVNYHFGGREGLYREVLVRAYQHTAGIEELKKLSGQNLSPQEKMNIFLDMLANAILQKENWSIRVVLREFIAPSRIGNELAEKEIIPKFSYILKLFADYLGLPPTDVRVHTAMISTVSTFFWMLLVQGIDIPGVREMLSIEGKKKELLLGIKEFSLMGMKIFDRV